MKKINQCIDCNQKSKPNLEIVPLLGVKYDRETKTTCQLIRCGCDQKKHCGAIHYKRNTYYFCQMKQVNSMCEHPQLRNDLFLEIYNAQFKN